MENAQNLINFYKAGFYVCLAIAALGAAGAVFLFFKFDIRRIISIRTGHAQQEKVREIKAKNSRTDHLRDTSRKLASAGNPAGIAAPETAPLNAGKEETSRLNSAEPRNKTAVQGTIPSLSPRPEIAADGNRNENSACGREPSFTVESPPGFKFILIQSEMLIHTNEII